MKWLFAGHLVLDQVPREPHDEYLFRKCYYQHIQFGFSIGIDGIILGIGSVKERRGYIVTSHLIGWAHTQNDLW